MANHHHNPVRSRRTSRIQNVLNHWSAAHRMQNLGNVRLHSGTFSRRQYNSHHTEHTQNPGLEKSPDSSGNPLTQLATIEPA
jgi:hypothetical protein